MEFITYLSKSTNIENSEQEQIAFNWINERFVTVNNGIPQINSKYSEPSTTIFSEIVAILRERYLLTFIEICDIFKSTFNIEVSIFTLANTQKTDFDQETNYTYDCAIQAYLTRRIIREYGLSSNFIKNNLLNEIKQSPDSENAAYNRRAIRSLLALEQSTYKAYLEIVQKYFLTRIIYHIKAGEVTDPTNSTDRIIDEQDIRNYSQKSVENLRDELINTVNGIPGGRVWGHLKGGTEKYGLRAIGKYEQAIRGEIPKLSDEDRKKITDLFTNNDINFEVMARSEIIINFAMDFLTKIIERKNIGTVIAELKIKYYPSNLTIHDRFTSYTFEDVTVLGKLFNLLTGKPIKVTTAPES
jgi:hypothetical protein